MNTPGGLGPVPAWRSGGACQAGAAFRRWAGPARSALLGCLAVGCLALGGGTDELKRALIGVDARELRSCVGVPSNVDLSGEQELLVYRFGAARTMLSESYPPADPERVVERVPGLSRGRSSDFCELTFALRGGKVEEVRVRARRSSGLNDDLACLRRAHSCTSPKLQSGESGQ
jgi:hypothetical protein